MPAPRSPVDIALLPGADSGGPRAILRVVQVLAALAAHPRGRTLAQLCEALQVPKTTLFNMLRVLQGARYVENDGGAWRLGPQAVSLAGMITDSSRRAFPDCALPLLQALSRRTGETVFLAELSADKRDSVYIAAVETDNWLRFSVKVGTQRPAYATGSGHAMLAFLPRHELDAALAGVRFDPVTSRTVTSKRALATALAQVRRTSVSVVDSGTVAGVTSVAAPIFGAQGAVLAAVIAGGPSDRMARRLGDIQQAVKAVAQEVSELLGYRGPAA
jgi:DNA-binding IclR family transcriptional regulator